MPLETIASLKVDLLDPGAPQVIHAVQDDSNSRSVAFSLYAGGAQWVVPDGTLVMVRVRKPDGKACAYDTLPDDKTPAATINGNVVTAALVPQAFTAPGNALVQIKLYDSSETSIATFAVVLHIARNVVSDAEIVSTDYYSILTRQIAEVLEAAGKIDADTAAAKEAAEKAAASATQAAGSASTASTAATNAQSSATAAAGSATSAGSSANAAAGSASTASEAASSASADATAAEKSAAEAQEAAEALKNAIDSKVVAGEFIQAFDDTAGKITRSTQKAECVSCGNRTWKVSMQGFFDHTSTSANDHKWGVSLPALSQALGYSNYSYLKDGILQGTWRAFDYTTGQEVDESLYTVIPDLMLFEAYGCLLPGRIYSFSSGMGAEGGWQLAVFPKTCYIIIEFFFKAW